MSVKRLYGIGMRWLALTTLLLSRDAGEGSPEPRARAFQYGRSCVSSYFLSAPKLRERRGPG